MISLLTSEKYLKLLSYFVVYQYLYLTINNKIWKNLLLRFYKFWNLVIFRKYYGTDLVSAL